MWHIRYFQTATVRTCTVWVSEQALHPCGGCWHIKHLRETHPICPWFFTLNCKSSLSILECLETSWALAAADRTGMSVRTTYVTAWKETKWGLMDCSRLQSQIKKLISQYCCTTRITSVTYLMYMCNNMMCMILLCYNIYMLYSMVCKYKY